MGHKSRTLTATSGHSRALRPGWPAGTLLQVSRFRHHRPSKRGLELGTVSGCDGLAQVSYGSYRCTTTGVTELLAGMAVRRRAATSRADHRSRSPADLSYLARVGRRRIRRNDWLHRSEGDRTKPCAPQATTSSPSRPSVVLTNLLGCTTANSAAKPIAAARCGRTGTEHRRRTRTCLSHCGRFAQSYGSEGR